MLTSLVVQESQRFHPTAPMLFREAREDVKIGPYLIPKGTMMVLHLMAMYQSENVFDSPKEFMPVRTPFPSPLSPNLAAH